MISVFHVLWDDLCILMIYVFHCSYVILVYDLCVLMVILTNLVIVFIRLITVQIIEMFIQEQQLLSVNFPKYCKMFEL